MRSECLPIASLPHTTRLFADYASQSGTVAAFYARSPFSREWIGAEANAVREGYDGARRARVADILEKQNRAWKASPATMENIQRLRSGVFAIVTGQQVGLFGGPLFAIYKALAAIKVAAELSRSGTAAVPVFWLATEDHDLAEVAHTTLLAGDGSLVDLATASHGEPDAPVSMVRLGAEIEAVVATAAKAMPDAATAELLRNCYQPGETLGGAFARMFSKLFEAFGVVLLDASDPELHRIAAPLYRSSIARCNELAAGLLARNRELEASGYHAQVKVTSSHTLLFATGSGARVPIHRANGDFVAGSARSSQAQLLSAIDAHPEQFSPNVLLRPVVQDYLLPTVAYIGGPAEVAYFAQAAVVYQSLLGRVTPVLPRFSATLVEARVAKLMSKYNVHLEDTFRGAEEFRKTLAGRNLAGEAQQAFDAAEADLDRAIASVRRALGSLDLTLEQAAQTSAAKMRYQFARLRGKAARAELRGSEQLQRHADQLLSALYPRQNPQEREIAGVSFLARHGQQLLHTLYDAVQPGCADHQIVYL